MADYPHDSGRSHIIPIQKAVGVVDDEVELYLHELSDSDHIGYSQGGSLMVDKPNVSKDNSLMVRSEDLSSFLNNLPRSVDIIKVDIEGYEVKLIPHLIEENVLDDVSNIFVETHDCKYKDLEDETNKMKELVNDCCPNKVRFDWI